MGRDGVNLGGKIRHKRYFPRSADGYQQDIRTEMILEMERPVSRRRSITTKSRLRARRKSIFASTACYGR